MNDWIQTEDEHAGMGGPHETDALWIVVDHGENADGKRVPLSIHGPYPPEHALGLTDWCVDLGLIASVGFLQDGSPRINSYTLARADRTRALREGVGV